LLDNEGYAKLCDFGFSRFCVNPTFTMCGSPEYMAPEIVDPKARQNGYTKCVDWWSLGVVTFELLAGQTPFHDEDLGDEFDFFSLLKAQKAGVPSGALPKDAPVSSLQFVSKLLTVDPDRRLGSKGADEVRKHPWFVNAGFDFEGLRKLTLPTPFKKRSHLVKYSPAPAMWNNGVPVEVLVTEKEDVMLVKGGDRYSKDLKVAQAIGLVRGMSARDYRDGKDEWCTGFSCPTAKNQDEDVVECCFKTHTEEEDKPGYTTYRCHTDLFSKYEASTNGPDVFKNFQLPASTVVKQKMNKNLDRSAEGRSSVMSNAVDKLMQGWTKRGTRSVTDMETGLDTDWNRGVTT